MLRFLGWSIIILAVLFFGSAILAGLWKAITGRSKQFIPGEDFEVYTEFDGSLIPLITRETFEHNGKMLIVVDVVGEKGQSD